MLHGDGSTTDSALVAVVILHYGSVADTLACVASLEGCGYDNMRVLIVVNGSSEGTAWNELSVLERYTVLPLEHNVGFAAGNNIGVRYAMQWNPVYLLLLNNDTEVEPGFLRLLVEALNTEHRSAAATGTIAYDPERGIVWFGGGNFQPWRGTCACRHLDRPLSTLRASTPEYVRFLTGCALLVRAELFREAEVFDERFFLYFEDAELSLRLRRWGHQLLYVPAAKVYHKAHHKGDTPFTLYYATRNRLLFASVVVPLAWRPVAFAWIAVAFSAKLFSWLVRRQDLFRAAMAGIRDFARGITGVGRGMTFRERTEP
jgi:GT2 family glycosyltransferase